MHIDLRQVGALFMVGLPGLTLDASSRDLIDHYGVNHFILFRRNVDSEQQVRRLCADLVRHCRKQGLAEPLIAIDQEGGSVARLPLPFAQFADARSYGEDAQAPEKLREYARLCVRDLKRIGVNLNFAPVLDVCPRHRGCFMERRSLGADPERVAELGALLVEEFQKNGIAACAKHFPGLGEAVIDPHLKLPVVGDPLHKIMSCDLLPFKRAVGAGVAAIMTSHVLYEQIDAENLATFSAKILIDLLRRDLGFSGLLVTDDLEMGAVENALGVPEASLRAFQAGADLLLICHDHDKIRAAVSLLHKACLAGQVSDRHLVQSFQRINRLRSCFLRNGD
ncbi:MAG: beta-N-acetylhexosaminidase [Desulfobulbaceae bacterium]|nr:MAG: beta-N-acetylhexosaminidase [Desulfobulbaceae bacterium]